MSTKWISGTDAKEVGSYFVTLEDGSVAKYKREYYLLGNGPIKLWWVIGEQPLCLAAPSKVVAYQKIERILYPEPYILPKPKLNNKKKEEIPMGKWIPGNDAKEIGSYFVTYKDGTIELLKLGPAVAGLGTAWISIYGAYLMETSKIIAYQKIERPDPYIPPKIKRICPFCTKEGKITRDILHQERYQFHCKHCGFAMPWVKSYGAFGIKGTTPERIIEMELKQLFRFRNTIKEKENE